MSEKVDGTTIKNRQRDWLDQHLREYLESGGVAGHITDVSEFGGHRFVMTLLLQTVGRKTGQTRTIPLIYGCIDGELVIVASKGGIDSHPAWYFNLKDREEVSFQIATQAFRGTWREPRDQAEYAALWMFMERVHPPYTDYQARTQRKIPLVLLTAREPISVFKT